MGPGGIGDGHPALQDINVRHAIYYAIDRDVLFDRVALGLGAKGTTMSPSADPSWVPDLGDELYTYDPEQANQILDDAGYLDTDGDGVREMPDGSRPLEFRYAERSESSIAAPIREFVTGWLRDIGISTVVSVMDDTQLYDAQVARQLRHLRLGLDAVRRPRPDAVVLHVRPGHHRRRDSPGSNDANWCSERVRRALRATEGRARPRQAARDIVPTCCKLFNRESTYLVLLQDADMQAYRTDRFEGWLQQPADTGPVLFTNTSPSYVNLSVIGPSRTATAAAGVSATPPADRRATSDAAEATAILRRRRRGDRRVAAIGDRSRRTTADRTRPDHRHRRRSPRRRGHRRVRERRVVATTDRG